MLHCRNSSADSTHSFSRDGKSLEYIFTAVSTGLQSLEVDNCNDIFTRVTLEGLQQLTQLKKLHITNFRQRLSLISFAHLTSLTSLQVFPLILRDASHIMAVPLHICLATISSDVFTNTHAVTGLYVWNGMRTST